MPVAPCTRIQGILRWCLLSLTLVLTPNPLYVSSACPVFQRAGSGSWWGPAFLCGNIHSILSALTLYSARARLPFTSSLQGTSGIHTWHLALPANREQDSNWQFVWIISRNVLFISSQHFDCLDLGSVSRRTGLSFPSSAVRIILTAHSLISNLKPLTQELWLRERRYGVWTANRLVCLLVSKCKIQVTEIFWTRLLH